MSDHSHAIKTFFEYFKINFRLKDLELLREISKKYSRIPYENITKIIKSFENPDFDARIRYPAEIIEEHIRLAAGGTCFSLVYFMRQILEELEYPCETYMADMRHGQNIHCAIVTTIGEVKYLVDPGYLIPVPMKISLENEMIYETPSNYVHIVPDKEDFQVFTTEQNQKKWRYHLKGKPVTDAEFRKYWQDSFSCNMMESVLVTRSEETERLYFRKNRFSKISKTEKQHQKVQGEEEKLLANMFGIDKHIVRKALRILQQKQEMKSHG